MIFTLTENIRFRTTYAYPFILKRRLLRSDKIWKFSFVQDNRSTKIRKDYEKDNEITIVLARARSFSQRCEEKKDCRRSAVPKRSLRCINFKILAKSRVLLPVLA